MPDISEEVARIREAIYGEEVRGSIADALETMNEHIGETSYEELTDIRVGADGKEYNSAGDAVRGQFLKAVDIAKPMYGLPVEVDIGSIVNGAIIGSTGRDGTLVDVRARTDFISFSDNLLCYMSDPDYQALCWVYRSASHTSGVTNGDITYGEYTSAPFVIRTINNANYFRIAFRRVDGAVLTTNTSDPNSDYSKIKAACSFYKYTDTSLSVSGAPADANAVGAQLARRLSYVRALNGEDDLDEIWEPGSYRWTSSAVPQNSPTANKGVMLVYGWTSSGESSAFANFVQVIINVDGLTITRIKHANGTISRWRIGVTRDDFIDQIPGNIDLRVRYNNDGTLGETRLQKGTWTKRGTRSSDSDGICTRDLLECSVGTKLDFKIKDGWLYSIWQGYNRNNLTRTHRLINYDSIIVERPYVGFVFYKTDENGNVVDTHLPDWDYNIVITQSGTTQPAGIHDVPSSIGVANVISRAYQMSRIQYETVAPVPMQRGSHVEDHVVTPAGTILEGVIYSSTRLNSDYVPNSVSFESYMTALTNPNSYIYTKENPDNNSHCYYGNVCSSYVAYCYGIDSIIPTTQSFATYPGFNKLPAAQQNPQSLKLGDAVMETHNHIVIITDIIRNARGRIVQIETSESWQYLDRSMVYTPEQFQEEYFDEGFETYRYEYIDSVQYTPSPWINLDGESEQPYANPNLMPRRGNAANWRLGDIIEIDILDARIDVEDESSALYTRYSVKRSNGTVVTSGTISSLLGNLIRLNNMSSGKYFVTLENASGSMSSEPVTFTIMDDEVSSTPLGNNKIRIYFDSTTGLGVPSGMSWCTYNSNDRDYRAVRAFYVFSNGDENLHWDVRNRKGYVDVSAPTGSEFVDDPVNGWWYIRVYFKTENGLHASALTPAQVTQ